MTTPSTETSDQSLARDLLYAARYYLGSRRGILILATIAIVAGIAFNWSWLVASGILPILLTALPCLVMCGLGLCMNKLFGSSCETQSAQPREAADQTAEGSAPLHRSAATDRASACCHEPADAALKQAQALDDRHESVGTVSTSKQAQPLDDRRNSHA
jgi:hypothetical protein